MSLAQLWQNSIKKSKKTRSVASTEVEDDVIIISAPKKPKITASDGDNGAWWRKHVVNGRECALCLKKHETNPKYERKIYQENTNIRSTLNNQFSPSKLIFPTSQPL